MSHTKRLTFTAIFAAIATVLMFYEFPLPFMPPFLKVDLSGAVILIGALMFGTMPALSMILIKDLIHLVTSQTAGAGELADFLMLSALVLTVMFIYRKKPGTPGVIWGCAAGTLSMSIVGILTNRFILIPFYSLVLPVDQIIDMCSQINPLIGSMNGYLMFGVLPFNLIKGSILTIISVLVYQRLTKTIQKKHSTAS